MKEALLKQASGCIGAAPLPTKLPRRADVSPLTQRDALCFATQLRSNQPLCRTRLAWQLQHCCGGSSPGWPYAPLPCRAPQRASLAAARAPRPSAASPGRCSSSAQEDALQRPQVFMQWPQGLSLVGLVMKPCPQLPQPACAQHTVSQTTSPKHSG